MTISKERYDELIQGIVGYKMFKDVLDDREMTTEEKIREMEFIVETVETYMTEIYERRYRK